MKILSPRMSFSKLVSVFTFLNPDTSENQTLPHYCLVLFLHDYLIFNFKMNNSLTVNCNSFGIEKSRDKST